MASIVYFFSKFTTEFLLLFATLFFALMAVYLFVWVIKRRRLGVARDLIPASVVRTYLNQLIGEAQGVRTQLFGILGGQNAMDSLGLSHAKSQGDAPVSLADAIGAPSGQPAEQASVPADLLARLQALEVQVREKESLIEGINDEKKRLQEQLVAAKSAPVAPAGSGSEDAAKLAEQVKKLEERLEEYSVIEDDLANLKRLQTENSKLREQLDSLHSNKANSVVAAAQELTKEPSAVLAPEPAYQPPVANKEINMKPLVDMSDLEQMLEGNSPTPPSTTPGQVTNKDTPVVPQQSAAPVEAKPQTEPTVAAPAPASATATATAVAAPPAAFNELDSSVDASLGAAATASAAPTVPMPAAAPVSADESKTEAELLQEFEKLLNS